MNINPNPNPLPDIRRGDVGVVLVDQWTVANPERQRAVVEAIVTEGEQRPWPEGLLSLSCFVSTDGEAVLSYAQWTDAEAHRTLRRSRPRTTIREEESAAHPGHERSEPLEYRLYRSAASDGSRVPGCIVVVTVETDGPERQRQWVDAVFDALEAETDPPQGGISGHFHVSTDGTRVLNYAEWIDEESHRRAIADGRRGPASAQRPEWYRVQNMPGVKPIGVKRYHLSRGLTRPSP